MEGRKDRSIAYSFMIFIALCLTVKYVFVDFGIDAEYQIAMSYRLAKGDVMFLEMWEAHQTSAFLCTILIKLYLFLFGTTTGIVLYLQLCGAVIDGLIALLLYRVAKKYFHAKAVAFGMAWVFFVISPKDMPIAEFANMQVWFGALLCIFLFLYDRTGKKRWLIFGALSLCGAVLSYPSCLILWVGAVMLLICRGRKKEVLLFTGVCVAVGIGYLLLIFAAMSPKELLFSLQNMLAIEPTHTVGMAEKFGMYGKDALLIIAGLAILYGISYGAAYLCGKGQPKEARKVWADSIFFLLTLTICLITVICFRTFTRYCYSISFLAVIGIGCGYVKTLNDEKRYLYRCGMVISFLGFLATLLLTDLDLISSVPYLLLAVTVSFLPIWEGFKGLEGCLNCKRLVRGCVICGAAFLVLRNAYIIRPLNDQVQTLLSLRGIVKSGPALGLISEYMGAYMQNESMKEWEQYVEPGSCIYLVGSEVDTLGYLYHTDTNIGAPSVMSTPGYNECIAEYWRQNPEKYPDMIIASCWYGELNLQQEKDKWLKNWLETEYKPKYSVDGKYWRYYYK